MQVDFDALNPLETDVPQVVNTSEPHMALLFLVDTSGSMYSAQDKETGKCVSPIGELNAAINRFKGEVCKDDKTKDILDVAIVEFNDKTKVIQEFTPVEFMKTVELTANGGTNMVPALKLAIDMVNERSRLYRSLGTEPYKPWIVMISDGAPWDDITEISSEIMKYDENGKLAVWALSVLGADNAVLHKIAGKRVLNLEGYDFSGFLDWAHKSMRAISQSVPGEKAQGQELPKTVTIDDLM